MKYSQVIGIIIGLILIGVCYMPWTYIPAKEIVISGMHAEGTLFGKPGLLNIILTIVMVFFFAIPRIWSKRTNVFIGALNFAWSVRNYLILTNCFMGECPEKKLGIFLLLLLSFVLLLFTFFPNIKEKEN